MVFRNTLAQSSQLLVSQLLSVILAPLLISRLGLEAFGVWAISGAVATYASLLDFGITRSLARFVALYDAQGNRRAVRECVAVGFAAVTVLGAVAVALALLTAPLVNDALGHPIGVGDMRTVLTSSAVLLWLNFYSLVCVGYATGLRRMIPPNVAGIFGSVCNFGASVAVLLADPHLTSYAMANAAAGVPALAGEIVAMVYVGGRHLVAIPNRERAREIVVFSAKNQVATVSDIVNFQTDKLVIAVAVGVRASAAYEIAARVAIAVRALGMLTLVALVPSATVEVVKRGRGAITQFYVHYTRRVLSVSVPVFALAALTAPYVLTAWIGETPDRAVAVLVGLSIAYMAWTTTGVA
ncbi:MAG TPA: oligosaccharide flippase family protein, partial [Solirubrobacteraceae bacterium]